MLPNVPIGKFDRIVALDPATETEMDVTREHKSLVMKRYANVERIQEAEVIGILIGTVVVDNHNKIIELLKR